MSAMSEEKVRASYIETSVKVKLRRHGHLITLHSRIGGQAPSGSAPVVRDTTGKQFTTSFLTKRIAPSNP
jgi:hypothetical protein